MLLTVTAALALALPPAPTSAEPGRVHAKRDLPANVTVRVKRGDLVMKGSTGTCLVDVTVSSGGLKVEGRGETRINGSDEPFVTDEVSGDWRMRFPRSRASEVAIVAESPPADAGVGGPRPIGNLSFVGGLRSDLEITDVRISGNLKVSLNRTLPDKVARAVLVGVTVDGQVKLSSTSKRTFLRLNDCRVDGRLRLRNHVPSADGGGVGVRFFDSEIGEVSLRTSIAFGDTQVERVTVRGDLVVVGNTDLTVLSGRIEGDLVMKANVHEQWVDLEGSVVTGATTVVLGRGEDRFRAIGCTLGPIDVRTGSGNDLAETRRTTFAPDSRIDCQRGSGDVWRTTDESALDVRGAEIVERVEVEP